MTHRVSVFGEIEKIVKRDGGLKFAVLADLHSYIKFIIPNQQYVIGQRIRFEGQITATEKATGYIRLTGNQLPSD